MSSLNWQSLYLALKMSDVVGSRYLIIDGESKPMYTPLFRCGPIFVRLGPSIGTITRQPDTLRWDIFGMVP